jgi:Zn-dependent protease
VIDPFAAALATADILLVPVHGDEIQIPRATWNATLEYLAENAAMHDSIIAGLRKAPGIQIRSEQAIILADSIDRLRATDDGLTAGDSEGLGRLSGFCRGAGGFLVAAAPPTPVVAPEPEPAAAEAATEPPAAPVVPAWQAKVRKVLGPFAVFVIVGAQWLAKLKFALLFLGKIKLLSIGISALWSFAIYAVFLGWKGAAALVLLLFLHEMGHVASYRVFGLGVDRIGFLPFFGAYAMSRKRAPNPWVHAWVALAGPIGGGLSAGVLYAIGAATGYHGLEVAGWYGFLLNLFNLVPALPLDGGWVARAMHPDVWFAWSLVILFTTLTVSWSILLMLFAGLGAWQAAKARKELRRGEILALRSQHGTTRRQKVLIAAGYLAVLVLLAAATAGTVPNRP